MKLIVLILLALILAGCINNYTGSKVYNGSGGVPLTVTDSSYTLYSPATGTQTVPMTFTADPTFNKAPSGALSFPTTSPAPQSTVNVPSPPAVTYIPPPPKVVDEGYNINSKP